MFIKYMNVNKLRKYFVRVNRLIAVFLIKILNITSHFSDHIFYIIWRSLSKRDVLNRLMNFYHPNVEPITNSGLIYSECVGVNYSG